jgi:glycosyltransferase involved in cell wall biosynthesis
MRLALVVPGGVDASGERRVIPALLALLARLARRHDVRVFALSQQPQPGHWRLNGIDVQNIGTRWPVARAIGAICRQHRVEKFDLVQSIWAGQAGLVATVAAGRVGLPAVIHLAGGELAALRDIGYGGRLTLRWRWFDAWALRRAAAVTAASQPIVDLAARLGVTATRIPLGVALDTWPPLPARRRQAGVPARLIHVGSLNRVKDQTTLLRATARLRDAGQDFRLDVVGEDTLGGAIQALARELGLVERVRFHGFLTQRELRPLMEAAHLHVISSRHEAGPLVLLEAAVAGVPTVGTSVGHVAEWSPGAALAVPPGDVTALAAAIRLLIEDESQRLELAARAQQRALAEDADFTARTFEALYRRILGS